MRAAYYNEIDSNAAQWIRNLIVAGHIAPGDVDERSIVDVRDDDLRGYTQCHFFAGIGGWSLALRLAGWPDDRPVWTGSCPCQPFSAAGKQKGFADERHLWPHWSRLIGELKPSVVFGEQVAAAIRQGWLDAVFSDLEAEGYACGAAVLPACGVGAPHIRQRLWFVADADGRDASAEGLQRGGKQRFKPQDGRTGVVAIASSAECGSRRPERDGTNGSGPHAQSSRSSDVRQLGDADDTRLEGRRIDLGEYADQCAVGAASQPSIAADAGHEHTRRPAGPGETESRRPFSDVARCNAWSDCDWLPCTDGKARPVEPGTFPLVDGVSFKLGSGSAFAGKSRVGMLRAAGNAIVPQVAAKFIGAAMEVIYAAAP